MKNIREIYKIVLIIPITLLTSLYDLISDKQDIPISSMLIEKVFSQMSNVDSRVSIIVLEKLFYIILFNILYGNFIYENFRCSSVYVFSRLKSRKGWFYKNILQLLIFSASYTGIFLGVNLLICLKCSNGYIDNKAIATLTMLFFVITIILALTTLGINLISIRYGNTIGYIIVYSIIMFLVVLAINMYKNAYIANNLWILFINPMCGLFSEGNSSIKQQIAIMIYDLFLLSMLVVTGARYIENVDISLVDRECM